MSARTQEFPYQLIAYIEDPELGKPVGPPWRAHVTIKRRFKLREGVTETQLVNTLEAAISAFSELELRLGGIMTLGESEVIEVTNRDKLQELHLALVQQLEQIATTCDPQFEGPNSRFHLTIVFQGQHVADASKYLNRSFKARSLWLVKESADDITHAIAFHPFRLGGS